MSSVITNGWNAKLKEYNARNASRLVDLEVIRDDLGAQAEAISVPLRGVSYDDKDDRVEIMLGDSRAHLTHTIEGVSAIDVLAASVMHGDILRIQHEGGQTLVSVAQPPSCCML